MRKTCRSTWFGLPLLALLLATTGCRVTDIPLWHAAKPQPGAAFEVEHISAIPYRDDADADSLRHRLDLFLPKGLSSFPVVFFIHGGAWVVGDNRCCGLYSAVGEFLASQGIGAVLPNYRLSPGVKHPTHIQDVARAFAWTHANIARHGGDPDRIIVAGHSAGAHLAALLATDERYLKAEGLHAKDIKGVVGISGPYHLTPGPLDFTLGGDTSRALRVDQVMPLRGEGGAWAKCPRVPGLPLRVNLFQMAFGNNPALREDASPVNHVRPGLPPFLLMYGDNDLPTLAENAQELHQALLGCGGEAELVEVPKRNHHSIIFRAVGTDDPVAQAMVAFVRRYTATASLP